MSNLTARQQQIFDLIKSHIEETGYPPTRAEISQFFGWSSANAAEEHIKALHRKGVIEVVPGASRGYVCQITRTDCRWLAVLLQASRILATEHIERLSRPSRIIL
ncbi:MAG: hypothetical protein U5O16_03125 [Rhodococcus sp. (in: high G+C Gram-positive bacteria)]|nr:hypothetical protein [Rhodococcus sp. (in: high G+C Gram-positive bacteria)]